MRYLQKRLKVTLLDMLFAFGAVLTFVGLAVGFSHIVVALLWKL